MAEKPRLDTTRLQKMAQAYWESAALMAAVELEVFTAIAHGQDTIASVAKAVGISERNAERLLTVLVAMTLLTRDGDRFANAADVERWVASTDRLGAIPHGHEHHGFRATLPSGGGDITILDPGASGYAPDPARDRTAHINVYEVDGQGISDLRRLRFADGRFEPEPGGPYATGR